MIAPSESNGRYVVYASAYAKLDSDVINGGGTDDTESIQAILDKAPEWGGLHLVMDGAALVRGLDIHSNTTIRCENRDCGFFLADGANRSIVQNAHPDYKFARTGTSRFWAERTITTARGRNITFRWMARPTCSVTRGSSSRWSSTASTTSLYGT